MRRTARLWKHSFRNVLLLTGLIFLLPDDRLPAQSCGWVSLPRMRNIITSELEIGPGNYAACYPYSGDFRKQYFVPGSRGHAYRLTFYPELYYGNYLNEYCNLGDLASFFVYRYNQNGTSSTIYNSGQLLFYPGNIYDPLCFSGGFNYPTPRQVIVHGEDIIEVAYVSSGCILEQDPGIGFFDASIECLQGGPISDISFDQPALPKFEEEQDYVLAQMTVPDDFLSPWWRLTVPNGCVLDPVAPGVDIGITVYAGAAAASGLPCTLECYEALSYSGGNQPLDWTYGISQSKFSRPITVLPAPHAQYSGIPYAGGVGNHHQIVLSVTSPAVFNAIQWQFVGDPQGCTLVYHPIDPKKAILTIGSIPAAGNLPVRIYLNALDSVSGYHKQGYVDIQPPPEIGLFKELGVGRNVQAGVTDPGAFGPNFLWFIDNRNPGNMDCSVEASGIVHAGTKVGTFNLHLRDTDSGYEIVGNFTILPAPTFALFTWDSQFSYPRSLIAGHNEWIPLIQVSGANMNMPVAVFESNPVGCQIRVEHILPAELNSGAVGANGGLIKLHIEDDDGYWVEQDFVVRRVPTLTYNDLNPVRAWGSAYSPTVTGDFLGGIQYDIHTAPHGYPNSGGTVPTASVIRSSGLFSAGSQDSYNLPFWTDVIAYDPTVVDYSAQATIATAAIPPIPLPKPAVILSDSTVPTGGTIKPTASVLSAWKMNLARTPGVPWPVIWSYTAPRNTTMSGGLIIPGDTPGLMTIRALDPYTLEPSDPATLNIVQPDISFAPKTILIANGVSETTASVTHPEVFPGGNTWSIASGSEYATMPSPGVIRAKLLAGPVNGTVTVRATSVSNPAYYVEDSIHVKSVPTISFDPPYLIADDSSRTTATVSDSEVFPNATWFVDPTTWGVKVILNNANPAIIEAGPTYGDVTVHAQSPAPDNYQITATLRIKQHETIQFLPGFLQADGVSTATASVDPAIYPNVTWALVTPTPLPGTTINSSGVIRAGLVPGTIRVQATDAATGFVIDEQDFTIRPWIRVAFDTDSLKADGKSKCWAVALPVGNLASIKWSIQGIQGLHLGCEIPNEEVGRITAGTTAGKIVVRATDASDAFYYGEGILKLGDECKTDCANGNCVGGGGMANNNSVDVSISLGYANFGLRDVALHLKESLPSAALVAPDKLWVAGLGSDVEVYPAAGSIQQVKSPKMMAQIAQDSAYRYHVNLYRNDQLADTPNALFGSVAHQSAIVPSFHQHYFQNATATLGVNAGDALIAYAYLDPANPPSEAMLQWNDGSWEHRAYWGADSIALGANNTPSRRYMGPLPPVGQWVRLEVPAFSVGLEGRTLNGMAFTLYGGRATWDYAGKSAGGTDTAWVDDNLPAGAAPYATGDTWSWTTGHTPGTAYQVIAGQQPFCTWTIENPIPGNYNLVRVTEARGAKSYVADYTYRTDLGAVGNGWDMIVDGGKRKERRTKTANTGVGADNTETYTIMDTSASDAVKYKEVRTYHNYPWGEELSNLTLGTSPNALSTTWDYYANSADTANYGRVSRVSLPGGSWESYTYESKGRKFRVVSQFLDNPLPGSAAEENNNYVKTFTYDDVNNIVGELVTLKGSDAAHEVSHKYTIRSVEGVQDVVEAVQCQSRGVTSVTASDNLTTRTKSYPAGDQFEYEPHVVKRPDGTVLVFAYSLTGGNKRTIVKEGQPNGDNTDVVDGVMTITVTDPAGNIISEQRFDVVNASLPLSSKIGTLPDAFGRRQTYTYGDGSYETMAYGCCGVDSITDRAGVRTDYGYDDMKRPMLITEAGVSTMTEYNVQGKPERQTRISPSGGGTVSKVIHSYLYDTAGRMTQSTDLIGTTTYNYVVPATPGHKVVTTYYPNNSTKLETYYQDGKLLSVGGTAVYPSISEYDMDTDGFYQKDTRVRGVGTDEWVKSYADLLQRPSRTVFPVNALSQTPFSQNYYLPATGQLWKQRDPDGVVTLLAYNSRGEVFRKAVDMDRNDLINTEMDRVEEYAISVQPQDVTMLAVKRTYVWDKEGTSPAVRTERLAAAAALDGSYQSSTSFGQTTIRVVTYNRGARKKTETETLADNTQRISAYIDKRLDSVTVMDASATPVQLSRTAYQYYTSGIFCGFLANMIDARNGTTSYTYNAADQIETITTPAPGFGQTTPQLTRFAYDETNPQGRIETVTLPDLTTVTRSYRLTGELKRISGSGVTPAEYDYEQGRLKSVKTWRTFPNDATAQTTIMNYSPDRGFLQSKTLAGAPGPSFTYYDSGRVKMRIWPRAATTTYNYNNAGEQWQVDYSDTLTNPDVTYTYNTRGQINSVVDPTGTHTTEYYTHGLVHTETHTGGVLDGVVLEHNYDAKLRPQTTIVRKGGTELYRQGYEYNPGDSYVRNITFDGILAHYGYENNAPLVSGITLKQGTEAGAIILTGSRQHNYLNQLVQATTAGSGATVSFTSQFNDLNKRQRVTLQDGSYWIYTYDAHGQLSAAKKHWSDNSPVAGQQFEYTFDDVGNRQNTTSGGDNSGGALRTTPYTPNARNQYDNRDVPGYANILGSANPLATVTADNVSASRKNDYFRVELPVDNGAIGVGRSVMVRGVRWDASANHDVMTEISKWVNVPPAHEVFQYDSNGNVTGDGLNIYGWSAENRLASVTLRDLNPTVYGSGDPRTRYLFDYDYLGRRVRTTSQVSYDEAVSWSTVGTITYVYDGWNLLVETTTLVSANPTLRTFAWGPDDQGLLNNVGATMPVLVKGNYASAAGGLEIGAGTGTLYLAGDVSGNVAALFNVADGGLAASYEYGPFGEPLRTTGYAAIGCPFGFAGKYTDVAGLVYYGYRHFSPSTGRWLSRDPIGEAGGVNLYGFVNNDPVNQKDFLGLASFTERLDRILAAAAADSVPEEEGSGYWDAVNGRINLFADQGIRRPVVGVFTGAIGLVEFAGRNLLRNPIEATIEDLSTIIAAPGALAHSIKCWFREKSGRWEYGSFDDRADLFMESLGDVFGLLASLGLKEADVANIIREARLAQSINAAEGGIQFGTAGDQFLVYASRAKPVNGMLDVAVHGSPVSVDIGANSVNHRVLASLIERNQFNGQGIRLLSCKTGSLPNGFAQNLANKLGVPVQAPNDIIWAFPNGWLTIGPRPAANSGSFIQFLPGGGRP